MRSANCPGEGEAFSHHPSKGSISCVGRGPTLGRTPVAFCCVREHSPAQIAVWAKRKLPSGALAPQATIPQRVRSVAIPAARPFASENIMSPSLKGFDLWPYGNMHPCLPHYRRSPSLKGFDLWPYYGFLDLVQQAFPSPSLKGFDLWPYEGNCGKIFMPRVSIPQRVRSVAIRAGRFYDSLLQHLYVSIPQRVRSLAIRKG